MAFINVQGLSLSFTGIPLLDTVSLNIDRGEKVGLVGRNGSGKSTLLKLLNGSVKPDSGLISIQKSAHSAYLSQDVSYELPGTVLDVIASGTREYIEKIESLSSSSPDLLHKDIVPTYEELERIHHELDLEGVWYKREQVSESISQLGLDGSCDFNSLSAGLKRQVLLKRALVGDPDILLLDEPTNHMDIDSIKELEQMMLRFTGALIFVTHDRMFLQRIASRIVEIDRGRLFDQTCDYETFLIRRSAAQQAEETKNALFDRKLRQEEAWIRGGIKARGTRNEGRVRELERMRDIRKSRRDQLGQVKMEVQEAERSGTLVAKAEDITFNYGNTPVIPKFSTTILKGDRIGIIGPNGSGKTTLLRLLLGNLSPVTGTIRHGVNLQIGYSDQLLQQLNENKTAIENVSDGNDTVIVNGKPRHIIGYLGDFLFSPDQARSPVSGFSGGERNRLMLARLFTRPSNLLVLDEPTNDLDIETLALLEDLLIRYTGTILLVTHDRAFINNVVTSTMVFEPGSIIKEYVGGYDDWLDQRSNKTEPNTTVPRQRNNPPVPATASKARLKLGFNEQRELDALPNTIEELELEQHVLFNLMADPELYKRERTDIIGMNDRLEELKRLLTAAYARWEDLEQLQLNATNNKLSGGKRDSHAN